MELNRIMKFHNSLFIFFIVEILHISYFIYKIHPSNFCGG